MVTVDVFIYISAKEKDFVVSVTHKESYLGMVPISTSINLF